MKKNLLLLSIFFVVILGLGLSFMQYNMVNPSINLSMIFIGGIGLIILGIKMMKK